MVIGADGAMQMSSIYRALVKIMSSLLMRRRTLVGGEAAAPGPILASGPLEQQLKLQAEAARGMREQRNRLGALSFDRVEAEPVVADGQVKDIVSRRRNRATDLIEDFMIDANETMAQTLQRNGVSSIRRVVRTPERWPLMMGRSIACVVLRNKECRGSYHARLADAIAELAGCFAPLPTRSNQV